MIIPKRKFSQNFLKDRYYIHRIVEVIGVKPEDHLVEIGPGMGALTFALPKARQLSVIEIDREAIMYLKERAPQLSIYEGDALQFDFQQFQEKIRVIGNLPYHISSPLIFHVLQYSELVQDMHFMLQKEVVDRMVALPSEDAYGRLSVMVQYHCQPHKLFEVPAEAFSPKPNVESAIIRLIPHQTKPILAIDYAHFEKLVAQAFSQRRKMLQRSLRGMITPEIFKTLNIDPTLRPENLSVADFVRLSNACDFGDM